MIESLILENFLSFEKAIINFGKVTVLVGPNASGKSNVIKALALLACIGKAEKSEDLQSLCKDCLHFASIEQIFFDPNKEVKIRANLKIKGQPASYEFSLNSKGILTDEKVTFGDNVLLHRLDKDRVRYLTETEGVINVLISQSCLSLSYPPQDVHPMLREVKDHLGGIYTYSFNADDIRSESPVGFNLSLRRDGSNLAQTLHTLLTSDRSRFIQIENVMKSLIPEIVEINLPVTMDGTRTYLAIREKGIDKILTYHNISDGTLRMLAFVTALYLGGSLVAFEEPENCVHPHLFETLTDLCRKSPVQVVITTHSPYLVDQVSPEDLRLVMKEEGKTRISHVKDVEKIRRLLEEGIWLGEAWFSELIE